MATRGHQQRRRAALVGGVPRPGIAARVATAVAEAMQTAEVGYSMRSRHEVATACEAFAKTLDTAFGSNCSQGLWQLAAELRDPRRLP